MSSDAILNEAITTVERELDRRLEHAQAVVYRQLAPSVDKLVRYCEDLIETSPPDTQHQARSELRRLAVAHEEAVGAVMAATQALATYDVLDAVRAERVDVRLE